jgi:hypothetical protein
MDKTVLGLPLKKKKESCKKPVRVIHLFDVENLIIVFFSELSIRTKFWRDYCAWFCPNEVLYTGGVEFSKNLSGIFVKKKLEI